MLYMQPCCCGEVCGPVEVFWCPPQFLGQVHLLWPVRPPLLLEGRAGLKDVVDVLHTSSTWALVCVRTSNSVEVGKQATVSGPESEYGDLLRS